MITFIFPGQGSQKKGMGGFLFDEFKDITSRVDSILGYSIKELCMENPNNQLSQTQYTQPALYVVNALTYLKKIRGSDKGPDYVAGHSLGEYNALQAAGAFDFETGLKLVMMRGELMSRASDGGMAAIIGLPEERINEVLKLNSFNNLKIANYNSPSQIVISGLKEEIDQASSIFEDAGVKLYIPLKVSGAFHTSYMSAAAGEFAEYIKDYNFYKLTIPTISNVHAIPYNENEIINNLVDQITHPVKWSEGIQYLLAQGDMVFEEIGPGNVLKGLVRKICEESKSIVNEDNELLTARGVKRELDKQSNQEKIKKDVKIQTVGREKIEKKKRKGEKGSLNITAELLGSEEYRRDYNLKYAYAIGGMYRGISSKEMIVRLGKARMISYFGCGGLRLDQIESAIVYIQKNLNKGESFGMNLLNNIIDPKIEEKTVELFLKHGMRNIEAAAYMQITPSLVRYRLNGLEKENGTVTIKNRIMAKISRPDVAELFLNPAPEGIVKKLLKEKKITAVQAELSRQVPMADDLCVEADSGGHTDKGVTSTLLPVILKLRDDMMLKYEYLKKVRVGSAGGIGTPEAAAAAFILGADFILTGSINQCTVEAGTSDRVKDLLEQMNVQDTEYSPSGNMFEIGAMVQVLKKGLFFPSRANKLYSLYRQYDALDDICEKDKKLIQERYFKKSFDEVYKDVKLHYPKRVIERAEQNLKQKMALVFRWYFNHCTSLAISGSKEEKVDYQIYCGPALGSFNQWVRGSNLESWRLRHVDKIGEKLMVETAEVLNHRFEKYLS